MLINKPYLIVGGGFAGASLAYFLGLQKKSVIVIDDARVGRASFWNPGGVNPLHGPKFSQLKKYYWESFELHKIHDPIISQLSGINFFSQKSKRLFVAKTDDDVQALRDDVSIYQSAQGFSANWIDCQDLQNIDSRLSKNFLGGLLTDGNFRLNAQSYLLAIQLAGKKLGVQYISSTLQAIKTHNDTVTDAQWNNDYHPISGLCMASGAWGNESINGWYPGCKLNLIKMIGDLLLIKSLDAPLGIDISHGLNAIYQADLNHYWIGGTQRVDGPLGEVTKDMVDYLLGNLNDFLPNWNSYQVIQKSSAARPLTANNLPVFGRVPNYCNASIMNGCGSKGVLIGMWIAHAVHKNIMDKQPSNDLLQFAPKVA